MKMNSCPLWSFLLLFAFSSIGCQSGPPPKAPIDDDYFFPTPPDLTRVQFLRSYNGSTDFKVKSPFLDYLAGKDVPKDYEVVKPFSLAMGKGKIYVTDSFGAQGVNVFDLREKKFYILGKQPGVSQIIKPIHVFVDDEGFKYISDLQKRMVLVYSAEDVYVRSFGDGSFFPVACVVSGNEIFILDGAKDKVKAGEDEEAETEERRDQILVLERATGRPLRRIGKHGSGQNGFSFASHLAVDRQGNLYVSDSLNQRVVKLDRQGNVLLEFGRQGDRPGDFVRIKGIAVDKNGIIYVVDAGIQRVQAFDQAGRFLFAMGGRTAPKGPMNLPAGVWIDSENLEYFREYLADDFEPDYLILVANQLGQDNRIGIYAFGKRKSMDYSKEPKIATLPEKPGKPLWKLPVFPPEPQTSPSREVPKSTSSGK